MINWKCRIGPKILLTPPPWKIIEDDTLANAITYILLLRVKSFRKMFVTLCPPKWYHWSPLAHALYEVGQCSTPDQCRWNWIFQIADFHCHAIKNYIQNHLITEAKNFKYYRKLINKQLIQASGLCGTPFLSYLSKRSTQISFRGTPTWRPFVWERLFYPSELVCIKINTSANTWTVQTAKNHQKRPFFFKPESLVTAPCWCHVRRQFWNFKISLRLYFKHKRWYRAGILWKDIFLGVPTPGDDKNLAGLAIFDLRILWPYANRQYSEKQTKTTTGAEPKDTCTVRPKMFLSQAVKEIL